MTISERIARNAKYLCHKQGKKLQDLEAEVGVSQGYLSRVKGRRIIPIDTAYEFAHSLNIDIESLMFRNFAKEDKLYRLEREIADLKKGED